MPAQNVERPKNSDFKRYICIEKWELIYNFNENMMPNDELFTQMMNGRLIWCLRQKLKKTYVENGQIDEHAKIDTVSMEADKYENW